MRLLGMTILACAVALLMAQAAAEPSEQAEAPVACGRGGMTCCRQMHSGGAEAPGGMRCGGHQSGGARHRHGHAKQEAGPAAPSATAPATQPAEATTAAQAPDFRDVIHALLAGHASIQRQVEDIAGGIRSVTTSEDPKIAAMIQTHVPQMKQRLEAGWPVRRWDPLFRELFQHRAAIDLQIELIDGGVRVTETSADPAVVALIRQHAHRGVSEFVAQGFERAHQPTPLPSESTP